MKTGNRQQLLLIVTIIAGALFVGDKLLYTPLLNLWKSRAKEIRDLRLQIRRGTALIRNEQTFRAQWQDMQANALPDNQSAAIERLSRALHDWAEESTVTPSGV